MPLLGRAGLTPQLCLRITRITALSMLACLAACLSTTTSPAAAAANTAALDGSEGKVIRLINNYRAARGRVRLRVSPRLNQAADRHSAEMVAHRYFAHGSANGATAARRVRGFRDSVRMGENIAFVGQGARPLALKVFRMWLASPSHRAVMLDRGFRRIGVGRRPGTVGGQQGAAYTADFASTR